MSHCTLYTVHCVTLYTVPQAAFNSEGWPDDVYKTIYYVVFFAWLATVHAWIAFKAELFPMDFYRYLTQLKSGY